MRSPRDVTRRPGRRRTVAVAAAVTVQGVLAAAWYGLFRRPLPQRSGRVRVAGIAAPVRIVRDRRGVPHIGAATVEDAAFAMGWVHAQDRGWQLELNRRVACGRVSELAGPQGLAADRFLRRLGLLQVCEAEERLLEGEARRAMLAYAAGVNAVWESGRPRPLEMQLLRIRPEPWRPAHTLAVGKLLNLSLAANMDYELRRFELLRRLGPETAAKLDFLYPDTNPSILAAAAAAASVPAADLMDTFREAARWIAVGPSGAGSNNWVVDGTMTATGRPMLCNDPHLRPSAPSVWYQAHVTAGDAFESTGVTLPGVPFPVIGHNRRIAWGFTNSFADAQDLVVEELDGAAARRYRTESGMADARLRREVIRVKGAADAVEEVALTRHGPLIERWQDPASGAWRGLALQWTALTPTRAVEAVLGLQRASGWDEFRAAMSDFDPSQNAVYADVDGHVGYFLTGRVPVRRHRAGNLPVPGWDGRALWERFLTVDEVPQVLDPAEHFVVTANNRVVGAAFPHHVSDDYMNGYRALRLRELLAGRTGLTAADMAAIQMDVVCPPAREVVRLLADVRCRSRRPERARRRLVAWNASLHGGSVDASLYEAFMHRLTRRALEPLCGEHWMLAAGDVPHPVFGIAVTIGNVTPHLLERWREGRTDWFPPGVTWAEVAAAALEDAVGDLRRDAGRRGRARWGRLHALPVEHALGQRRPLSLLFNAGTVEVGGDTDTVLQTAYMTSRPYRTRAWAPSWRQIVDVGGWDACTGIHFPGQSGHPGSPHYRDMTADWARNRQHRLSWSPEAVAAEAAATLSLEPLPGDRHPPGSPGRGPR